MGQLIHEVNDSVYFINGEGFFIDLDTPEHHGLYDLRGVEALLIKEMQAKSDTSRLEDARSILRTYVNRFNTQFAIPKPDRDQTQIL